MNDTSDLIYSMIRKTTVPTVNKIIYSLDWEVIVRTSNKENIFNELQQLGHEVLEAFIKGLEEQNINRHLPTNNHASIQANKQVIQFCQNVILNSKLYDSLPNKIVTQKSKKI